jgi:hypothetical protein
MNSNVIIGIVTVLVIVLGAAVMALVHMNEVKESEKNQENK